MESASIEEIKRRARVLHTALLKREPAACARLRALREFREVEEDRLIEDAKHRHCLSVVSNELGFEGWQHASAILNAKRDDDFGTLLNPPGSSAHWNIWSASYDEAKEIRAEHGGYLLGYKKHYFIVDQYYVETLGLDPNDADWERIGRDWVKPASVEARDRLYAQLIRKYAK